MENINMMDIKINYSKDKLINSLESLIRDCQYEVDRLKNDENYKPNGLGIIQYNSIDIECARLYALYEAKSIINLED